MMGIQEKMRQQLYKKKDPPVKRHAVQEIKS